VKGRHRAAKRAWAPFHTAEFPEAFRKLNESDPHYVGVFRNNIYQVTMRETPDGVTWLSVVRIDREPVNDWRDKQRIKNELCGPEREGIELYPCESRLVDTNNQVHLYVLPVGSMFPFGYTERDVSDVVVGVNKQRPFEHAPPDLNAKRGDQTTFITRVLGGK
jgi:hypothetical protein